MNNINVLIVNENPSSIDIISLQKKWEFTVNALSIKDTYKFLSSNKVDAIIISYQNDIAHVLQKISGIQPSLNIIILGQPDTAKEAVLALKSGNVNFTQLALLDSTLKDFISNILEEEKQKKIKIEDPWFCGKSPALTNMFKKILQVGQSSDIILLGNNGTGKERIAKIINGTFSTKHKEMITINLKAFPDNDKEVFFWSTLKNLFQKYESEIKGIKESLYKTLYLEGLESCDKNFWTTLLGILKERNQESMITKNIRIIIGLQSNYFIEELPELLSEFKTIKVPSLIERREDVPEIIKKITTSYNYKYGRKITNISLDVLMFLTYYNWPGNLKELDMLLETMILNSQHETTLTLNMLPLTIPMIIDNINASGHNNILPLAEAKKIFKKQLLDYTSLTAK